MPANCGALRFFLIASVVLVAFEVNARAGGSEPARRVTVCVEDRLNDLARHAQAIASAMFAAVGVTLEWHDEVSSCQRQPDAMVVSFMMSTPKKFHPGALAYALPYEGVHIQVLYDRIARADPELVPSLMANVIVHEITHILQGIDRHSTDGIMKAVWNSSDYTRMKRGQLRFTAIDVEMIHDGFAARTARHAASTFAAAVAP